MHKLSTTEIFDLQKVNQVSEFLRALTHPLRIQILNFINQNREVNEIYGNLDLEQSITSQHLKVLRNNGLVATRKQGKYVVYSINYDRMAGFDNALKKLINQ